MGEGAVGLDFLRNEKKATVKGHQIAASVSLVISSRDLNWRRMNVICSQSHEMLEESRVGMETVETGGTGGCPPFNLFSMVWYDIEKHARNAASEE